MISTQILIYTSFNRFCGSNVVIRKALHSLTGARVISTFSVRVETAAIVFECFISFHFAAVCLIQTMCSVKHKNIFNLVYDKYCQ